MASSRPAKAQGTVTRLRGGPHEAESADLLKSCLEYAREPNASVDDILMFLFQLNLDLRRMVDDPAEDPLARMMELSLEYGVETPVSFVRQYDVTGDASAPYVIKITVNRELKDFFNSFRSLEEAEILTFYQLCIRRYAQLEDNLLAEQLVNADDELSDFLNKTEASIQPSRIDISKLAEATGVTEGRWKQLLGSFGRSSGAVHKEVIADEQALSVVAYMSRPLERLAMRRHLSWHVLRYMVGPQADITMAANQTDDQVDPRHYNSFRPRHPEVKCRDMLGKLRGVPYAALSFWEGNDIVPTAAIVNVTRFMGEFQAAMGSVFRGTAVDRSKTAEKENVMASGPALSRASQVPLFPNTAGRDVDSVSLFAALDGGNESIWEDPGASTHRFPFRWVRHLRAWYALPPLLQALLPRMASVAHVDKPEAFFRPPYYDATAPPEYNFATLGQVVSQVMAHQLVERRHVDPAVGKRWRGFWDGVRAFDNNSVYCMRTGIAKNGTWREKRLDDNKITNKERLVGVLGSRIAYLAFLRAQRLNASWTSLAERLPGVHLSSQQIFFIMHCAVSCVIGRGGDAVQRPANEHCVVAYRSGKRSVNRPCRQAATGRVPNECNYI